MITLDDAVQMMDACSIVMSRNTQTAWNIVKTQLSDITAESDRLALELAELKERIEESTIITVKINDNRAVYPTLYPEDFNLKEGQWKNFRLFPIARKEGAE